MNSIHLLPYQVKRDIQELQIILKEDCQSIIEVKVSLQKLIFLGRSFIQKNVKTEFWQEKEKNI